MSDMPAHAGEYYFLAPKSLTGNINSIFVGNIFYKYERIYTTGQELWYGKHDVGDVLIETKDGKKYSTAVQGDTGSTGKLIMDVPYFAVTNGTRPTWYAFKPMASFPSKFRLVVQGHIDVIVSNNGTRWEGNGWIVKQSDVVGRGMAVVGPNKQSDGAKALVYEV